MPVTFPDFFVLADAFFPDTGGCFIIFALPGVGSVVQYHLPFASAHALPSFAVAYVVLADILLPNGSSKTTLLLVLLKLSFVADE